MIDIQFSFSNPKFQIIKNKLIPSLKWIGIIFKGTVNVISSGDSYFSFLKVSTEVGCGFM